MRKQRPRPPTTYLRITSWEGTVDLLIAAYERWRRDLCARPGSEIRCRAEFDLAVAATEPRSVDLLEYLEQVGIPAADVIAILVRDRLDAQCLVIKPS